VRENPRPIAPGRKACFVTSTRYRRRAYGTNHPLAIPRVALTLDLIEAYGAITAGETLQARLAADVELEWFHARDYIAAIRRAEVLGRVKQSYRERYHLGTLENPYFDHFFGTPATATGASIQAAEQVIAGRVAFNPAGGMHHARPGRAHGFCYFNDPVLGVMRLRRAGWRVLYVDIDAHHCDGVEAAFRDDPDTLTLSLHMDTAYAFPNRGGALADCGPAEAGFTAVNIPLPRALTDAEYRLVFDSVWPRVLERFRPDAVVLQAGTDMLAGDPLGKWRCTTQTFLEVAGQIAASAPRHADGTPRLMAIGGGGYHPLLVARAWTGLWGILSGRTLPAAIPERGADILREVGWDQDGDEDQDAFTESLLRSRLDGPADASIRTEVREIAARALQHPFLT
jgi:acetoin utilization protein AcuC